jgi:phage-related protein
VADSRELQYNIGFNAGDGISTIDQLERGLNDVDNATERVQTGAQQVSQAMNNMGAAGVSAARNAGSAAEDMGARFDDAGDDIEDRFKGIGAEAESFGAAFRKTMAAGIKDGQSLAKSFQTGVSGAFAYSEKKFVGFRNNVTKGAEAIGTAFAHPIQTIKNKLSQALTGAGKAADDTGGELDGAAKEAQKFGDEGSEAGNKVKDAISGALKSFLGVAAIVAATKAIVEFGKAAIEAAAATENTSAKFDRLFKGTQAEEWANNYADAVHRSTDEVKSFMVGNQAMYSALGITGEAATDLSKITTSLAYDFGNAFSMDDAEALSVLQEGIKGNKEALAEYGFNLDDATIKAEALKVGLSDNIDEMDDATLAQLRLNAILDQSADVQQAAINQTDGLVNSTKSLKGIWSQFMADAGAKFTPVIEQFFGVIMDAWPRIEPMLMGLVEMLSDGLSQALPIITELGMVLIPVLTDVLGTVFQAATPLIQVFGSLAQTVLPPLANIIGLLVETLMPPIVEILNVIISLIEPLMPVIQSIAEAILPPIAQLLGLIAPILEALSPVLEVIGSVLKVIGDVLGTVIGWLADGVGAVVNFFSGLFGGAKESKDEIEGLNGAVNGLEEATNAETSLAVDTSSYTSDISNATAEASAAAEENIIATKDISDLNLQLMGVEASSTYATMAVDAETCWSRMTTAAENGAQAIVAAFQRIASAAQGVSNANVSVSGVSMPGNAGGTDDFEGGWTKINERGGEVAFLPSGSAIIPADKSDRLIESSTSNTQTTSFSPSVQITITGQADSGTTDDMVSKLEAMFKRMYDEARADEYSKMSIKNAYT